MKRLVWTFNRLRLMGPAEIGWRVQQKLQQRSEALGLGLAPPLPSALPRCMLRFVHATSDPDDADGVLAAADRVLTGRWQVFALEQAALGFPPEWNRDPRTGTLAPLALGTTIDHRDEALVGDIKYLWEPARHLELVTLALAWARSRERRFADGARRLLESWIEQCPYRRGVHWNSALELAVRLVNWAVAWQLLDIDGPTDPFDAELRRRWTESAFRQAHFIRHHLSRHSSANNHLFGELMGLFVAALQWPVHPECARWADEAQLGLEAEADLQVAPDGVHREQAIYYHHEVMDMMLICDRAASAAGRRFGGVYLTRLERMAEFLAALMDSGGNVPMWGDADDARMLRVAHGPADSPYQELLACCALRFDRGDLARKARTLPARGRLFWGDAAAPLWSALSTTDHRPQRMAFPEGGYYLLGDGLDTDNEVRAVVDCGPLGYLSIAAHGHADALAMTLSVGGHEVLVDPGTYAYHTQRVWRDHFRGTAAHNTLRVDGVDQSRIGGSFMWLDKATSRCRLHDTLAQPQRFLGEHDGYHRLSQPVTHERSICYDRLARSFEIVDRLHGRGEHFAELHWHFAESVQVRPTERGCIAEVNGWRIELQLDDPAWQLRLARGEQDPPLAWISRRFDRKTPSTTLVASRRAEMPLAVTTRITIQSS